MKKLVLLAMIVASFLVGATQKSNPVPECGSDGAPKCPFVR